MTPKCMTVRLACNGAPPLLYKYGVIVKPGVEYAGCRVLYASPSPCQVAPTTKFTYGDYVDYTVREYERDVVVRLDYGGRRRRRGSQDVYVYPRNVWEEVKERIIEPLQKGEAPEEAGVLLYGPPGTGKTSMAIILSQIHGLYPVFIEPASILSKYVGESEKRIAGFMRQAEENEPSIVILDDADWLIRPRETLISSEDVGIYLSLLQILLSKFEEWYKEERRIVTVITTNRREERIEGALRRSGRLGEPVFVPLPDYEGVSLLMRELGVPEDKVDEWARKAVNAGLPMSDVVSLARKLAQGRTPRIRPRKGRGYTRVVAPEVSKSLVETVKGKLPGICEALGRGSRLAIIKPPAISVPLAVILAGSICKKPVVLLTDQRAFDEAVDTADNSGAVLVLSHDYIDQGVVRTIANIAKSTIIYAGSSAVPAEAYPISLHYLSDKIRRDVVKALAEYHGVPVDERALRAIERMETQSLERLLQAMGLYKARLSQLRALVAPYG